MKKSVTIVFTFLFVLVLAVYLYLESKTQEVRMQQTAIHQEEMKLFNLPEGDQINWLKIQKTSQRESIILVREGELWNVEFPVRSPADMRIVNGLLASLTLSYKVNKMKPEKGWEEYGLKEPSFKVSLRTQKDAHEKILSFGSDAQVGSFVFARWNEEKEYFLLPAEMKAVFLQSLYHLRQKNVFQMDLSTVSKIHFKTADADYELAKNKEKWFWMEPISVLGEFVAEEDIAPLLKELQNLGIKEFLDQPFLDLTKLGLQAPVRSIVISQGDREESVGIGNAEPTKEAFYVKHSLQESPCLISSSHLDDIFEFIKKSAEKANAGVQPLMPAAPLSEVVTPAIQDAAQTATAVKKDAAMGAAAEPKKLIPLPTASSSKG